ncbi:MAG: thioredoxin family protein [Bacteroidetes bacterium]|nr:thioredoxin family protein [Bacteroidota bacterium]
MLPAHRVLIAGLIFFAACSDGLRNNAPAVAAGVHFEDTLTWTAVCAKAKAENKYIFVDCYASWCGPCKMMNREVFPQPEVGEYFNQHFVSIGVQLDSTAADDSIVRRRYKLGYLLKTQFGIHAFPTFLVFTPDGRALHRLTGARRDPTAFIRDVSEVYDTTRQYYTQLNQFIHGRRDSAFLGNLAYSAKQNSDPGVEQAVNAALSR